MYFLNVQKKYNDGRCTTSLKCRHIRENTENCVLLVIYKVSLKNGASLFSLFFYVQTLRWTLTAVFSIVGIIYVRLKKSCAFLFVGLVNFQLYFFDITKRYDSVIMTNPQRTRCWTEGKCFLVIIDLHIFIVQTFFS